MADDILKNIPLPADLPENWTSEQTVAPTGAEVGMDEQYGYNYLMRQVNNAQKALKALAAQREEDLARIKFWVSNDPTSPASFIGGTWERIEDCTIWGASSLHPAGTKLNAGLPNITGSAYGDINGNNHKSMFFKGSGALRTNTVSYGNNVNAYQVYNSYNNATHIEFNAQNSNSIYGKSSTVQPPAYCMYLWRRVE